MSGFGDCRNVLSQEILVLHRGHGMADTHHRANFVTPISACIHHDLCADVALFGMNRPGVVCVLRQTGDRRMAVNLCPGQSRTSRQRLTQLGRINVAVMRIPQSAQQVLS